MYDIVLLFNAERVGDSLSLTIFMWHTPWIWHKIFYLLWSNPAKEKEIVTSECLAVSSCMLMLKESEFAWGITNPHDVVWEDVS